ncbi:hypothetical protein [Streptomyces sp. DH24]|uniref:hypothetical protein n=1 Tax=Streptomyces sp. DH24 TaxID=3040123 RepID=UPI002441CFB6|nr:hypothetical protein [Streptomyces sp. DH24]MDG9717644.1 hypothetical protein [Streptomyces sp. DH24]
MELVKPDVAGRAACRALQTGVKPSHTHALVGILCDQGVQRLRQGGSPVLLLDGDRPAFGVVAHPFDVGWMNVKDPLARVPDAAFVTVPGARIDVHMDLTRDSEAAVAWPQAEMASSAVPVASQSIRP